MTPPPGPRTADYEALAMLQQHQMAMRQHDGTPYCPCGEWTWQGPFDQRHEGWVRHLALCLSTAGYRIEAEARAGLDVPLDGLVAELLHVENLLHATRAALQKATDTLAGLANRPTEPAAYEGAEGTSHGGRDSLVEALERLVARFDDAAVWSLAADGDVKKYSAFLRALEQARAALRQQREGQRG